ncbi:MAG: 3-isopropylmalate dehydratase small subunit [Pseudomonadota bacterium]
MEPFQVHQGVAAPMLLNNIDTDAIIPSREMKRVSKKGLGEGLFAGWRYTLPGGREPNPDFVLNQSAYVGASILLGGANFGCGSSREHAAWALKEFGIRALIAPSFGSIFYSNCIRNGILPVVLTPAAIDQLSQAIEAGPQCAQLRIDLPRQRVATPNGSQYDFEIDAGHKRMLLEGLDGIALTLEHATDIDAFEAADRRSRPWIYG